MPKRKTKPDPLTELDDTISGMIRTIAYFGRKIERLGKI